MSAAISVIIPSRNAANLVPCVEAVRKHEPNIDIYVIDDGIGRDLWSYSYDPKMHLIDGIKPFIFARNCNIGIKATGRLVDITTHGDTEPQYTDLGDDVILLNDDALLESPGGFTLLQKAAQEHPEYGLISATTNLAGNPAQMRGPLAPTGHNLRECCNCPGNSVPVIAFVCVFIARWVFSRIGLLDERFTAYGFEDGDFCRRAHLAGIKIGIHDGCYVDHSKLTSTFRGDPRNPAQLEAGRKIYLDKWKSM